MQYFFLCLLSLLFGEVLLLTLTITVLAAGLLVQFDPIFRLLLHLALNLLDHLHFLILIGSENIPEIPIGPNITHFLHADGNLQSVSKFAPKTQPVLDPHQLGPSIQVIIQ